MVFRQTFLVITCLVVTSLVKANPVPALSSTNSVVANHVQTTCTNLDDCCILDFTGTPCEMITKPLPIDFSYAGNHLEHCVNVVNDNGNPTAMNHFWIPYCNPSQISGILFFGRSDCKANLILLLDPAPAVHTCYTTEGGGIASFQFITKGNQKRAPLGGQLVKETDLFSTSAYTRRENVASVAPPIECFDKNTGVYILGCKVERSDEDVHRNCNNSEPHTAGEDCVTKRSVHIENQRHYCINSKTRKTIEDCIVKRVDENDESSTMECWDNAKNTTIALCIVGRSELPPPECMDPITGEYIVGCIYNEPPLLSPPECFDAVTGNCIADCCHDKRWQSPPTPRNEEVDSSPLPAVLTGNSHVAVIPVPNHCKEGVWCITFDFGQEMYPSGTGSILFNPSNEGNYECVNLPIVTPLTQVRVTHVKGQIEDKAPQYFEATFFEEFNCNGEHYTTDAEQTRSMMNFWVRSYRVSSEQGCVISICPCPGINVEMHAIDNEVPQPGTRTIITTEGTMAPNTAGQTTSVTFKRLMDNGGCRLEARTIITTKSSVTPKTAGETAGISF